MNDTTETTTESDWVGYIGDAKVRAYYGENGDIVLAGEEGLIAAFFKDRPKEFSVGLTICRQNDIPIMPWEWCVKTQNGERRNP